MVFNATFNNSSVISWWSVLLVEETGVQRECHRPVASHWQTSSHEKMTREIAVIILLWNNQTGNMDTKIFNKTLDPLFYVKQNNNSFKTQSPANTICISQYDNKQACNVERTKFPFIMLGKFHVQSQDGKYSLKMVWSIQIWIF